jgi:OOP family OmpA-OmpF porin
MRCNWRRWLWGIIPLLVLSWVAVQAEHGRVERELAERARLALVNGGFPWAQAEFDARDAVLTGRAPQEGEPGKAADALAAVWGVRVVDNKAGLLDKADTYLWAASRRKNRIRLTGYAPSISAKQAILGVTRASFPGFEVVDRTTLARGLNSTDVWLAGVSFGLKQLTSLKRGDVRMQDLGLAVIGEAEDVAAYRAVKQALASGVPKGIKVTSDRVTAPVVSPFKWTAQLTGGRFLLTGSVPEAVRAQLVAAAKESLPGAAVVDEMEPGEGAPPGWAEVAIASVRELARLEGGGTATKDATLIFTGTAADGATAEAIRARLRAALPAAFKLTDQIRVKELPPPIPPPLPPPSPTEAPAKAPEAPTATRAEPPPQPAPPTQAVEPVAVVRARACEAQLAGVARAGQILFRLASAELESVSFPTLDQLAQAAKSCPGMHIEVGGHASSEGSAEINQRLSLERAQSVVAYLVNAGVDGAQLEPIGFGATRPVAPNDSSENMAKNRRIEFTVRPQ